MMRLVPRSALIAAYLAAVLSFASAAVTAYWLLGGTALLSTVGGELERFARNRSIAAVAVAVGVVVAKVVGGVLALVLTRRPSRRLGTFAAAAGALLALYGAVLTILGAFALFGVLGSSPPADEHALRWHVAFWDPWFLVWGLALAVAGTAVRGVMSGDGARNGHRRAVTSARESACRAAPPSDSARVDAA
jgi:hypothetical protein